MFTNNFYAFASSDLLILLMLIERLFVGHLKRFRVQLAIDPVMLSVLRDEQLRVVRQRNIRTVVVERLGLAVRDSKIRIFLYFNPLLPLPDERRVDLPLLLLRHRTPQPFASVLSVAELLFVWCKKSPNNLKRIFHKTFSLIPSPSLT